MKLLNIFLIVSIAIGVSIAEAKKVEDIAESGIIAGIQDIVDLYKFHQFTYQELFPPANQSFIQTDPTVFPARLKPKLQRQLVWEKDANGFELATILCFEDYFSRETVILNSRLEEVARVLPFEGYDPYGWIVEKYDELPPEMYPLYDSARIWAEFTLIPADQYEDYILTREQQRQEELMVPGMMAMSLPETVTELMIGIDSTEEGFAVLELKWPTEVFSNRLEIFSCENLRSNDWKVASSKFPTIGNSSILWTNWAPTNLPACFYRSGDADTDSDGDTLTDARELIVYDTLTNNVNSDGDLLGDGVEVAWGYTDPAVYDPPDADGDQMDLAEEYAAGTSPLSSDSDGDGLSDPHDAAPTVWGTTGDPTDTNTLLIALVGEQKGVSMERHGFQSFTESIENGGWGDSEFPPRRFLTKTEKWELHPYDIIDPPLEHKSVLWTVNPITGAMQLETTGAINTFPGELIDNYVYSNGTMYTEEWYEEYDEPYPYPSHGAYYILFAEMFLEDLHTPEDFLDRCANAMEPFEDEFRTGVNTAYHYTPSNMLSYDVINLQYKFVFNEPVVDETISWIETFTPEPDPDFPNPATVPATNFHSAAVTGTESPVYTIDAEASTSNGTWLIYPLDVDLVPDYNRDGIINEADRLAEAVGEPFRFWVNDDDDSGYDGGNDIPDNGGANGALEDYGQAGIDGERDLVDFFPVLVDVSALEFLFYLGNHTAWLTHADGALNVLFTDLKAISSTPSEKPSAYLRSATFWNQYENTSPERVDSGGVQLPAGFLVDGKGVLLLEARAASDAPLVVEFRNPSGEAVAKVQLPLKLCNVEDMYKHINLRPDGYGHAPATGEPTGYPDSLCNEKNIFFLHGFNVSGEAARGWAAEMFKRLYWSGSNARFWGVTWEGDLGLVNALHYQEDVANCFLVASNLYNEIGSIPNKTILAHSLGNMVVSAAIEDYGLTVDNYFMLNAAVAIECYDATEFNISTMDNYLVHEDWLGYNSNLWSSTWHELFDGSDDRGKLTWKNRFSSILDVAYNYHSTGDEIFELKNSYPLSSFSGGPFHLERYAWQKQEIFKGRTGLGSTDEAGWGFSGEYTLAEANAATPNNLRTNAVFRQEPIEMFASNIVKQTQNEILALGIPALSGALGRNRINLPGWLKDYDMNTGRPPMWPDRGDPYTTRWLHSDLKIWRICILISFLIK